MCIFFFLFSCLNFLIHFLLSSSPLLLHL
jgi:hypothetical protein